jgi:uncharacterized integral membrane protein
VTDGATSTTKGSLLRARNVVAGIVVVLAVVFIAENTGRVRIRVIGPVVTARLWEALLGTFVAGMVALVLVQRRRRSGGSSGSGSN